MMSIIQLTQPEIFPTITHLKICNWTFEIPRALLGKDGFVDIWLAKCYLEDGIYYEVEVPGINIKIEGEDFNELKELPTTIQPIMKDATAILSQFLVDKGYFSGIMVEVNGD